MVVEAWHHSRIRLRRREPLARHSLFDLAECAVYVPDETCALAKRAVPQAFSRSEDFMDTSTRIREVFARAVELSPDQRLAFMRQACGDDGELRAAVEELLKAHES